MRALPLAALFLAGCMTPHSAVLGQTAAPLGVGGTEVGLAFGGTYQSESSQPTGTNQQNVLRGFGFPAFEANGAVGIHRIVNINLHASAAGLQPGAKIVLVDGHAKLAVMPQFGFGYSSQGSSTFLAQDTGQQKETNPSASTALTVMAGLKLLASHRSGVYGGVGYDFESVTGAQTSIVGVGNASTTQTVTYANVSHNVSVAVGFDASLGHGAHLRPEIAALFTPQLTQSSNNGLNPVASSTGYGFLLFPSLTFSVTVPGSSKPEEEAPPEEEKTNDSED